MTRAAAILLVLFCPGICAAQMDKADYDTLAQELGGRISFEELPAIAEPGQNLDGLYRVAGATLGERLAGQTLIRNSLGQNSDSVHDAIDPAPLGRAPTVIPGGADQNLSVAFHRGFGSNAMFPLGPSGFPDIQARGEGALSIHFNHEQDAFGLRIHADYSDPLGARPGPGQVQLTFYDRSGAIIDSHVLQLSHGITDWGFKSGTSRQRFVAVVITNTDPGGIAIDDILFQRVPLSS